jgi:hypothetical protein
MVGTRAPPSLALLEVSGAIAFAELFLFPRGLGAVAVSQKAGHVAAQARHDSDDDSDDAAAQHQPPFLKHFPGACQRAAPPADAGVLGDGAALGQQGNHLGHGKETDNGRHQFDSLPEV